jgi:hypothetical protein
MMNGEWNGQILLRSGYCNVSKKQIVRLYVNELLSELLELLLIEP